MKHKFYFTTLFLMILFLMTPSLFAQKAEPEKKQVKPALLVIDIQNEYLKYMSDEEIWHGSHQWGDLHVPQHNLPIIRVYHTDPQWGPQPGTEPFEFPKSVIIKDDDPKVIKNFPSAFQKTELDKILKEKGCNALYLCGLSATACVLPTYFGGMERDYKVFMVKEGIVSHNFEYTRVIRDICETVSFETMAFMLGNL